MGYKSISFQVEILSYNSSGAGKVFPGLKVIVKP